MNKKVEALTPRRQETKGALFTFFFFFFFSALKTDPGIHLALLYDYHKRLDCLHKNVEWSRMLLLPLVAAFYWKGQVCPRGKAKTLTVLCSLLNRLCNQGPG